MFRYYPLSLAHTVIAFNHPLFKCILTRVPPVLYIDKPTAPQSLRVSNVTKDSCELTWERPESDGGSKITNYVVDKKDASKTAWYTCGSVTDLNLKVTKLFEDTDYYFRVAAENKIGVGDYVTTDDVITAKLPFGEYF